MRLDRDLSERIEALRFPLIVAVVMIHAYPTTGTIGSYVFGNPHPGYWAVLIRNLFSEGICRIPVPMLFLFSGFFFFLGMEPSTSWQEAWPRFISKWKSRIKSLLIPYLLWNLVVMVLIGIIQESPAQGYFSETGRVSQFSWLAFINALTGFPYSPIAYQLWFIRNLMVLTLLAPLLFWFLKRLPVAFLVGMGLTWVLTLWPLHIPDSPGLFYFSLGGALALYGANLRRLDRFWPLLLMVYLTTLNIDLWSKGHWYSENLHRIGIFCGFPLVFALTHKLSEGIRNKLILWAPMSFFLYALHEPTLSLLRRLFFSHLNPQSDAALLIFYVINPFLVILFCVGVYRLMAARLPTVLGILTGDRRKA